MSTFFATQLNCATQASKDLIKNWPILLGVIAAYFIFLTSLTLAAPFGIVGGFIVGAVFVALLGQYFSWLQRSQSGSTVALKDLAEFDSALFFQVMSVAFIFWIVFDLLLGSVSQGTQNNTVLLVAQFAAIVIFNAIPEILYLRRLEGIDALGNCFQFVKDHYIEWFFPTLLLLLPPFFLLSGEILLLLSTNSSPLLPFSPIFSAWSLTLRHVLRFGDSLLSELIPLLLCHWFMLFRGHLFVAIEHNKFRRRA